VVVAAAALSADSPVEAAVVVLAASAAEVSAVEVQVEVGNENKYSET
jgi:hypothetical protein